MSPTETWIRFDQQAPVRGRRTNVWVVRALEGEDELGHVSWYSPWRRYCFFPLPGCAFEQDCLRKIAEFIEVNTRDRRAARAVEKQGGS